MSKIKKMLALALKIVKKQFFSNVQSSRKSSKVSQFQLMQQTCAYYVLLIQTH